MCRAVSFKVRELICQHIALAADPEAFRHSEDAACVQVAVKITAVVAARPKGGSPAGLLASTAAWAGLA